MIKYEYSENNNDISIPKNATNLRFDDYINRFIDPYMIPISVTHLEFGHFF